MGEYMNYILELKNLKKYYGKIVGIEDVSLSLKKGEIYGFIGPNGAGKSTTIRALLGLINKTSGEILFKGENLNPNDVSIKEKIGYLPSEINLYSDMTVKEILDYHETFYNKNIKNRRKELVKLLKIKEDIKIEELSLGNLKKIGIVLALMHGPELLILDEPTSGLDPIMQNVLHSILVEERKKGTTILYSSHILSEVSSLCDRIGFIKDGRIIKEDSIENILKNSYTYLTIASTDILKIKNELKLDIKSENGCEVTFLNNMDINILLNILSKYKVDKLLIENVSLEDLFSKYYR